jgi:hypothetical protein
MVDPVQLQDKAAQVSIGEEGKPPLLRNWQQEPFAPLRSALRCRGRHTRWRRLRDELAGGVGAKRLVEGCLEL